MLSAAVVATSRPLTAAPEDVTATPGEFVIEHPTLINLGFEWHIDGDANRNASVDVSYRKQGETSWRKALPLARLHGEQRRARIGGPNYTSGHNGWVLAVMNSLVASRLLCAAFRPILCFDPSNPHRPWLFSR